MEVITICLAIVIVISMIIMAILLYNFMQLLSTLNKRMIATISDILGNIDLSTPKIDNITRDQEIKLEDVLEDNNLEDGINNGFNPHNYDPFKEDNN